AREPAEDRGASLAELGFDDGQPSLDRVHPLEHEVRLVYEGGEVIGGAPFSTTPGQDGSRAQVLLVGQEIEGVGELGRVLVVDGDRDPPFRPVPVPEPLRRLGVYPLLPVPPPATVR